MTYVVDNRYCINSFMVIRLYYFFWWFINSYSSSDYTDYCYSTIAYRQKKIMISIDTDSKPSNRNGTYERRYMDEGFKK